MSKYIKRLLGKTSEEAMVVQAKICSIKGNTAENSYTDLILEWKRGDTVETSAPFGEIQNRGIDMNLAIIFNKLSIFFKQEKTNSPNVYQPKLSSISLYSFANRQKTFLGEGEFELSQYVGKIREAINLRLSNGPPLNGVIHMQVSIVPIT